MHKVLHSRDDVERLYVSRKADGRGLANKKDCVNTSIQGLEDFIRKRRERVTTVDCYSTNNIRTNRTGNRNENINNHMNISSDKLAKSPMRKPNMAIKGKL